MKFINKLISKFFPLKWEWIKDEEREGDYAYCMSRPSLTGIYYVIEEQNDGTFCWLKTRKVSDFIGTLIGARHGYSSAYAAQQAAQEDFNL